MKSRPQEIILKNWRNHRDARFPFHPVNLFVGDNNQGKTGILAAIEMVLVGQCQYTDDNGRGGNLRTAGADSGWELTLRFANGDYIKRSEQGGPFASWAPQATTAKAAQQAIEEKFGGKTSERARLALRGGRFFELKDEKRKALLSRCLELDITADVVMRELMIEGQKEDLPLLQQAHDLLGYGEGLAALEKCLKKVITARTGVNRAVEDGKTRLADLVRQQAEMQLMPETEGKQLAAREGELERELQQVDQQIGRLEGRISEWDKLHNLGSQDGSDLARDQARLAALEVSTTEEILREETRLQKQIDDATKEIFKHNNFEREQSQIQSKMAATEAVIRDLQSDLAAAGFCKWAPESPCAGASVRQADSRSALEKAQERLDTLSSQLLKLDSPLTSAAELKEALDQANAQIRKGREALEERRSLQLRVNRGAERLTKVEAMAQEEARERPAVERQLEQLKKNRANVAGLVCDVRAELERGRATHRHALATKKAREELDELLIEQKCLDYLREFFSPTGLSARVAQERLGPFQADLFEVLNHWGMQARYDERLDLAISRDGGPWLDYESLSTSDRILVELAHQVGFATKAGCGIVVVDEIETIDDKRQVWLLDACVHLSKNIQGLDRIVLLGVRCVEPPSEVSLTRLGGPF